MAEADTRPGWLEERICLSLKVKPTLFKKLLESEGTNRPLLEFLNNNDAGHVFFVEGPKELQCFDTPPAKVNKKAVYFVKLRHAALTNDNMDAEIVSGELVLGALSHMYRTCQEVSAVAHVARRPICRASPRRPWPPTPTRAAAAQRGRSRHAQLAAPPPPPPPSPPPPSLSCRRAQVYLPLLSNVGNQAGWPEVISREVVDSFHKLVAAVYVTIGQTQGKTLLPLPAVQLSSADRTSKDKARRRLSWPAQPCSRPPVRSRTPRPSVRAEARRRTTHRRRRRWCHHPPPARRLTADWPLTGRCC